MAPLRRHQLVRLQGRAWQRLQDEVVDAQSAGALRHWARAGLPLVVCRQPCGAIEPGRLSVGLAAPLQWQRQRWVFTVALDEVLYFDEFPFACAITPLLDRDARPDWSALCRELAALGVRARVYGSHGWQHLTGLAYLRTGSDLDLCLPVDDAAHADDVAQCLARVAPSLPRLDGEFILPDGGGIAWREWQAWRAGRVRTVLVKRLYGVEVVESLLNEALA